jgi:hypothetical protein
VSNPLIQSACVPLTRTPNKACRFRLSGSGFSNPTVMIDDPSSPAGWDCTVQPPLKPSIITVMAKLRAATGKGPAAAIAPAAGGNETGQITVTVTNDDTSQAVLITDASFVD